MRVLVLNTYVHEYAFDVCPSVCACVCACVCPLLACFRSCLFVCVCALVHACVVLACMRLCAHAGQYPVNCPDVSILHRHQLLDALQDCVLLEDGLAKTGREDVEAKELQGLIAQDQFFEVKLCFS